ncbi:MAG: hypothetical protein MUP44_08505, partial [Anaerolineales bacterium]|nr:hypothetical protein [Anaerolineales bacterium]
MRYCLIGGDEPLLIKPSAARLDTVRRKKNGAVIAAPSYSADFLGECRACRPSPDAPLTGAPHKLSRITRAKLTYIVSSCHQRMP